MREEKQGIYQIQLNGITVWINTIWCVARFGRFGFDMLSDQSIGAKKGTGHRGNTTRKDWIDFVKLVHSTYGVSIYEQHAPTRLQD